MLLMRLLDIVDKLADAHIARGRRRLDLHQQMQDLGIATLREIRPRLLGYLFRMMDAPVGPGRSGAATWAPAVAIDFPDLWAGMSGGGAGVRAPTEGDECSTGACAPKKPS